MRKLELIVSIILSFSLVFCSFCSANNLGAVTEDEMLCGKILLEEKFSANEQDETLSFTQPNGCFSETKIKKITPSAYGEVVLCTETNCSSIQWTFGGDTHSGRANCNTNLGFTNVPPGYYSWSASGCNCNWSGSTQVESGIEYTIALCPGNCNLSRCQSGCGPNGENLCSRCPLTTIIDNQEDLEILRKFRDEVLAQIPVGQEMIRLYYEWSPVIIKAMEDDEEFKEQVKEMIDGILPLIRAEVE